MSQTIILASTSEIRKHLLETAGLPMEVHPARVDESTIKASMIAAGHTPRDIADALAEAKAQRVASQHPGSLVLGADQVLEFEGDLISKPESKEDVVAQITRLSGNRHKLHSAAVFFEGGRPVWRYIASVTMTMRALSPQFVSDYADRNWHSIRHSVGGYKIEEEGVRLFSRIDGSHFAVLGLPLLEILSYLSLKGAMET